MALLKQPITPEELDQMLDACVFGATSDQAMLQAEAERIEEALKNSDRCASALGGCIMHIQHRGPGCVPHGLYQSVSVFFVLAMKIMELRHSKDTEIKELDRLLALGGEHD